MRVIGVKIALVFACLFSLIALFWHALFYTDPRVLPSALIGQPLPAFSLPSVLDPADAFTTSRLAQQPVSLLNVWASWCEACTQELPILMQIHAQYAIPIFGLDYKDGPDEAKAWLNDHGNPYTLIGNDAAGNVAIDLGVYGTPETFVISHGMIVYRQVGIITQDTWNQVLLPLLKKQGVAL